MLANHIVLIDNKLADARNFPELRDIVLNDATFFWRKSAIDYQQSLIQKLPTSMRVELRDI